MLGIQEGHEEKKMGLGKKVDRNGLKIGVKGMMYSLKGIIIE